MFNRQFYCHIVTKYVWHTVPCCDGNQFVLVNGIEYLLVRNDI